MPRRHQHCAKQDCHVVAVSSPQFQHPAGGVKQFDPENVAGIAHVLADPGKERADLRPAVFRRRSRLAKNLYRPLPHIEIARALANQIRDEPGADNCAATPFRHPHNADSRYHEARTKLDHSLIELLMRFMGTTTGCLSPSTSTTAKASNCVPPSVISMTLPCRRSFP